MKSLLVASLLLSIPAAAEPLKARNTKEVRVAVAGRELRGLQVRPTTEGWRLELGAQRGSGAAEVIDVTPGTPARFVTVAITAGEVLFDRVRFVGGHVYRVQLRVDNQPSASGYVYLVPETPVKEAPRSRTERVRFDGNEQEAKHDVGIAPVEKSPL